jgi:L-fuculose-phosphate aldolase
VTSIPYANAPNESGLRLELVHTLQAMSSRGLNRGTSGNASVRCGDKLLITPTGIVAEELTPEHMVLIDDEGRSAAGQLRPSSEWRMHMGILTRRPDLAAVVHCHSRYATVLACAGRPIPAIHYMVAVSGRAEIPLAPYRLFGSEELAAAVVEALQGGNACLMANHGQIAASSSLGRALAIAEEIEEQAAVYCGALAIGGPKLLSPEQMQEVMQKFRSYGQRGMRQDTVQTKSNGEE